MSDKRQSTLAQRREVREQVIKRDQECRLKDHSPCFGDLDVHEVLTRARGGDPLDPNNCVALCRTHHDFAHRNPKWAEEVGLLRHSWGTEPGTDAKLQALADVYGSVAYDAGFSENAYLGR